MIDVYLDISTAHHIEGRVRISEVSDNKLTVRLIGHDGGILYSTDAGAYNEYLNGFSFMFKGNFAGWVKALSFSFGELSHTTPVDVGEANGREFLCVHNEDFMFRFIEAHPAFVNNLSAAVDYYMGDARESATKLQQICERYFDDTSKLNLLEFASGYGRITRCLDKNRFNITACDIHVDAIQYIMNNIGVNTVLSTTCPEEFNTGIHYDVVFALSFFTHMPDNTFGRWLQILYNHVAPGGIFVFTTHGRIANETSFNFTTHEGYAFKPQSEQNDLSVDDYGTTVSLYEYVDATCKKYINATPAEWHEGFWHANIQDVYIIKKPNTTNLTKLTSVPLDFNDGYCVICESESRFYVYNEWLRDYYVCGICGSVPRQRALINALNIFQPDWRALQIHESSPDGASSDFIKRVANGYSSSQFFQDIALGDTKQGIRCENVEKLTFADKSFDIVITQDVLEHVISPEAAFKEIARVLKPGGAHFFTVPWCPTKDTLRRATRNDNGEIEYLEAPVYHDNPLDEKGSLVVSDFGRNFISEIQCHSALTTMIYLEKNKSLGLDAEYLHIFVSRKAY